MSEHRHPVYVPGCYRCDLSRDEVRMTVDRTYFQIGARSMSDVRKWLADAWDAGYSAGLTDESAGNVSCRDCATTNPYRPAPADPTLEGTPA